MFERITIRDAAQDSEISISITFVTPEGWQHLEREEEPRWVAFNPPGEGPHTEGFALLVIPPGYEGPEGVLNGPEGLGRYLEATLPGLSGMASELNDDVFEPYELRCFQGKIEGVPGRVMMVGMAIEIEGFCFAMFGFSRDELFEEHGPTFQRMIKSFQPLVQTRVM